MKRRFLLLAIVGLTMVVLEPSTIGQSNRPGKNEYEKHVEAGRLHPHLTAEYSRVAAIKVASRKSTYHLGEMITVDVALLNTAKVPMFFHKLDFPTVALKALDNEGKETHVFLNTTILEGITVDSYSLLPPGGVLVKSFLIATQCSDQDRAAYIRARQKLDQDEREGRVEYQKGLFERNLFVNWGEGCLHISKPGTYFLTAQLTNDDVIVSRLKPAPKTAVGMIDSNPMKITIIE